jgi:predicted DNA-binding protein YlxM (UPF0122 family)
MIERFEISILLDFYGDLLTEKQREIMDLYFNDDLSLAEISENNNTSRQAIHDIIKRCQKLLLDYENKLGLMKLNNNAKAKKKGLLSKVDSLNDKITDLEMKNMIEEIKSDIIELF